jgi:hypothetical protein
MAIVNGHRFRSNSATFTRPADATAYTAGDLVANSVTAASVVPLTWLVAPRPQVYTRIRLHKSTGSVTNAAFRIHLYGASPVVATNGDNAAYATDVANSADWLGSFDGTFLAGHSDGAAINCLPTGNFPRSDYITAMPATAYGLVEALGAYTPGNAEIFIATLFSEFDR